jgi:hypothetical protein
MRMMIRISLPTETSNPQFAEGTFAGIMQNYLADAKPEAVYFVAKNGVRTTHLFVDMTASSQLPAFCEAPFLAYNAKVDVTPAMNLDDLKAAMLGHRSAVRKCGPAN